MDQVFTTFHGSMYFFKNNKTIRFKTPHQHHDPNDVSLKKISDLTVFVTPEFSQKIGWFSQLFAPKKRIALIEGRVYLFHWNTKEGKMGMDKTNADNTFSRQVLHERCPLELWDRDLNPPAPMSPSILIFKSFHPGNVVTNIMGANDPKAIEILTKMGLKKPNAVLP